MTTTLTLLAAFALGFAPAPSGQDADAAAYQGSSAGTNYYDFDDDDVEGEVLSAEGANITSRPNLRHESLIKLRPHFIPELTTLALDL
jgi:hypothetical protein